MAKEIPQELLDEMIHMPNDQFDQIEKKWINNLGIKKEYESQYYNQLKGHLDYNKTFKDNLRPLKPHEHAAVIDEQLLSEAKMINHDRIKTEQIQQQQKLENPAPPSIGEKAKEITAQLFAAMKYDTLEREWEAQRNHTANDLHPSYRDIELEQ